MTAEVIDLGKFREIYVRAVVKQQPILFRSHNNFALIAGKAVKGLRKPKLTLSRIHEAWVER
jgi:hypothetical protein